MAAERFRLITRGDFDGVVCGALLRDHGLIDEIVFAHPNDMQHGRIQVSDRDITTNLPYVEGCHLAFDHHSSEVIRTGNAPENFVNDPDSPSVARVVYNYYGAAEGFYRQALQIQRKRHPEGHREIATAMRQLAQLYMTTGDFEQANALHRSQKRFGHAAFARELGAGETARTDTLLGQCR